MMFIMYLILAFVISYIAKVVSVALIALCTGLLAPKLVAETALSMQDNLYTTKL